MPGRVDITGRKFGRLLVVEPDHWDQKQRSLYWKCLCDCGNQSVVCSKRLKKGETKSCGCFRIDAAKTKTLTHGRSKTKVYGVWNAMKMRCYNPLVEQYKNYGDRGIRVCYRWMTFENFYADMGDPPLGMSIDRIANDGHYEPENCRWTTMKEQRANQRPR